MGRVIHHAFQGPTFGGAAFTDNALAMARDAIRLPDVPEAVFWGAVCTLAESPIEADRQRALQIWNGFATGFHETPEQTTDTEWPLSPWMVIGCIAAPLVAGLFGRAVYEAVRAGGMGGF